MQASREGLTEALRGVSGALVPAKPEAIVAPLGELSLQYWQPDHSEAKWAIFFGAYIEDLGGYPADLILTAIKVYRKKPDSKFFPKIGQLIEIIEPLHRARLTVVSDLRARLKLPEKETGPDQEARSAGAEWGRKIARGLKMSDANK